MWKKHFSEIIVIIKINVIAIIILFISFVLIKFSFI